LLFKFSKSDSWPTGSRKWMHPMYHYFWKSLFLINIANLVSSRIQFEKRKRQKTIFWRLTKLYWTQTIRVSLISEYSLLAFSQQVWYRYRKLIYTEYYTLCPVSCL
jgi:hypothetical protein